MFLALFLAASFAPPDARPRDVLLKKLETAFDKDKRGTLVRAVAQLQRPDCEEILRKYLTDDDEYTQFQAMYGLLLLGHFDDAMKKVLLDVSRSTASLTPTLNSHGMHLASVKHDYSKAAAVMVPLFESEIEAIRDHAVQNYIALNGKGAEAVPGLLTLFKRRDKTKSDMYPKIYACRILAAIGPKAEEARSTLEDLLAHKDHDVNCAAAVALLMQDATHPRAMKHLLDQLESTDLERADSAAEAISEVPESLACFEKIWDEHRFPRIQAPHAACNIARAMAKAGFRRKNVDNWLLNQRTADSLLLRMDAARAFSTLYPKRRDEIAETLRLAFSARDVLGADELAQHFAQLDNVPAEIARIAKEKYVDRTAYYEGGTALALVALKADPTDRDAEAFVRKCLADDPKNDRDVARGVAASIVGDSGPIGKRFRDDLIKMLEADGGYAIDEAAVALRKLDAQK